MRSFLSFFCEIFFLVLCWSWRASVCVCVSMNKDWGNNFQQQHLTLSLSLSRELPRTYRPVSSSGRGTASASGEKMSSMWLGLLWYWLIRPWALESTASRRA